jgi:hypothetical protein
MRCRSSSSPPGEAIRRRSGSIPRSTSTADPRNRPSAGDEGRPVATGVQLSYGRAGRASGTPRPPHFPAVNVPDAAPTGISGLIPPRSSSHTRHPTAFHGRPNALVMASMGRRAGGSALSGPLGRRAHDRAGAPRASASRAQVAPGGRRPRRRRGDATPPIRRIPTRSPRTTRTSTTPPSAPCAAERGLRVRRAHGIPWPLILPLGVGPPRSPAGPCSRSRRAARRTAAGSRDLRPSIPPRTCRSRRRDDARRSRP